MDSSKQYREFGAQCDHLADEVKNGPHEKILREMAAAWRGLAEEIEKKRSDR
jgi:hypothetical protein